MLKLTLSIHLLATSIESTVRMNLVIVKAIVLLTIANKLEMFVTKVKASTGELLNQAWQEDRPDQMLLSLLDQY
jgi:hypothetical protein